MLVLHSEEAMMDMHSLNCSYADVDHHGILRKWIIGYLFKGMIRTKKHSRLCLKHITYYQVVQICISYS